ncbi:hypothetical protein TKK_0010359 [Trichogramma kaykai]|uniref:Phospholipid/glycerol acyltransferase domain-containing protein n=1 Tax=Trichogramma kaykai TaxID=54128 RepID=A0ABD2WY38_9HYME
MVFSVKKAVEPLLRFVRVQLYIVAWSISCVSVILIFLFPTIGAILLSPALCQKYRDEIASFLEKHNTKLLELFGTRFVVYGDPIKRTDSALLISNHRTLVDWNLCSAATHQLFMPLSYANNLRMVAKDQVRRLPVLGALGQIRGAIYLKRNWRLDKDTFVEYLDYHREIGKKVQILFFPEGTDFTEKSRCNSDRYASERGLPLYRHVIHPRTTGFVNVALYWQQIDCLDAIYDLTFAYPDLEPNPFKRFLCGHLPYEIHVHVRRFDKDDLPRDEIGLKHWLQQRWKIKEESLTRFHEDKRFDCPRRSDADGTPLSLLAFILWSFSCFVVFMLLIKSLLFQIYAVLLFVFVEIVSFTVGLDRLEVNWYWRRKSILSKLQSNKNKRAA